jgi:hypothetical protein
MCKSGRKRRRFGGLWWEDEVGPGVWVARMTMNRILSLAYAVRHLS